MRTVIFDSASERLRASMAGEAPVHVYLVSLSRRFGKNRLVSGCYYKWHRWLRLFQRVQPNTEHWMQKEKKVQTPRVPLHVNNLSDSNTGIGHSMFSRLFFGRFF